MKRQTLVLICVVAVAVITISLMGPKSKGTFDESARAATRPETPSPQAAAPGWSRGQQNLAISYDECLRRMQSALQAEGYRRDDQPGGNFAVGIKNPHTAVIICGPAPEAKMLVQIVVASNGDGGGSERQCLQAQMEQPGASRCGRTPRGNCDSPVGDWTWWNGTKVSFLPGGMVQNNTGLRGDWRLESGYVNVRWSNGVIGRYRWVGDGNTLKEIYQGVEQTMRRSIPCGN